MVNSSTIFYTKVLWLTQGTIMSVQECPFCREEIKTGAIKCKHCGSAIVDVSRMAQASTAKKNGTLWLPIPALVIGIIFCLALFDDSYWTTDELLGALVFSVFGLVLSVVGLNVQEVGRGMSIAGVVLTSIASLAYLAILLGGI